jgi:xanthine/uracil permease
VSKLVYGLDERLPGMRGALYALQWFVFGLLNVVLIPLVAGPALHMGPAQLGVYVSRTLLAAGLACLFQLYLGHRLPNLEAPAGLWLGVILTLAAVAPALGLSPVDLRAALELAFLLTGGALALLGGFGLLRPVLRRLTPMVTGTVIVLLVAQLSGPLLRGILLRGGTLSWKGCLEGFVTVVLIVAVALAGRGFARTVSLLAGFAGGTLVALVLGDLGGGGSPPAWRWPAPLPWGTPLYSGGVLVTAAFAALILLANLAATLVALGDILDEPVLERRFAGGVLGAGVGGILSGLLGGIATVPYTSSPGVISLTGVAARRPFLWASLGLVAAGLVPAVGHLFAQIPAAVTDGVALAAFTQMMAAGLRDYGRLRLGNAEGTVIGLALLVGLGVMFVPGGAWAGLPPAVGFLGSNGLVVGTMVSMIGDGLRRRLSP